MVLFAHEFYLSLEFLNLQMMVTFDLVEPVIDLLFLRSYLRPVEKIPLVGHNREFAFVHLVVQDLGQLLQGCHAYFGLQAADDVL